MLVERFETRIYEKGDKLVVEGEDAQGLHLVASGEVAVVAHEHGGDEAFVVATLSPGETVGEVALVLRRKANADVIAVHPTVTLFLPREHFLALVHDHPTILHGLYMTAVRRDDETALALDSAPAAMADDYPFFCRRDGRLESSKSGGLGPPVDTKAEPSESLGAIEYLGYDGGLGGPLEGHPGVRTRPVRRRMKANLQ